MGTDQQQKGSSGQIDAVEEASERGAGFEQERARASDGHRELQARVRKLKPVMEDFANQISDLRGEAENHSTTVINLLTQRSRSHPDMELPFSDAREVVNWLSTSLQSDKDELQKKNEALNITETRLMS